MNNSPRISYHFTSESLAASEGQTKDTLTTHNVAYSVAFNMQKMMPVRLSSVYMAFINGLLKSNTIYINDIFSNNYHIFLFYYRFTLSFSKSIQLLFVEINRIVELNNQLFSPSRSFVSMSS